MNRAEVFCSPVMAPKFFQRLLSHTAQPYQQMPMLKREGKKKEQNKYHMHQHTAYQNNFQLGDNVLYQWNSHRLLLVLLRTTGAALLQPWPCSVGLTARGSWGDVAGLLHTCTHTHTHTHTCELTCTPHLLLSAGPSGPEPILGWRSWWYCRRFP